MKKLLFPAVCLLLVLSACKKSGTNGTLTAYVNGVSQTYNTNAVAELTTTSNAYQLAIGGSAGDVNNSDELYMAIEGINYIVPGTYTSSSSSGNVAIMAMQKPGNIGYSTNSRVSNPVSITINSISSSQVSGTFTGSLILVLGSSSDSILTVTNGSFNVGLRQK